MRSLLTSFHSRYGVPAVIAAIVTPADDLAIDVVGIRRRGNAALATVDDQWHLGSCGKAITAALFARLVESGAAEWQMPISSLFPDLVEELHPGWRERTIDEVFICRAGIRANLTRREILSAFESTASAAEQRTAATLAALTAAPGRSGRFVYSNLGYVVAGAAIDRVAGLPFEDALVKHVWEPLGITSSGLGPPPAVWGHHPRLQMPGGLCVGRGAPADPADRPSDNPTVMNSAGRMHMRIADWARFHRAFFADSSAFLRPDTISHLLAVPPGPGLPMAMGWTRVSGLKQISYAMQGSNTMWSATAVVHDSRRCSVLVVCNDGRTRVLRATAQLAGDILTAKMKEGAHA